VAAVAAALAVPEPIQIGEASAAPAASSAGERGNTRCEQRPEQSRIGSGHRSLDNQATFHAIARIRAERGPSLPLLIEGKTPGAADAFEARSLSRQLTRDAMTSESTFFRWRTPTDRLSRDSYVTSCVDAALAPLRRYLNGWQAQLVRSIVEASIEVDPVSRRLLANALRTGLRSYRRLPRAKGAKVKLKNTPQITHLRKK
jgi:hypothetical protein